MAKFVSKKSKWSPEFAKNVPIGRFKQAQIYSPKTVLYIIGENLPNGPKSGKWTVVQEFVLNLGK